MLKSVFVSAALSLVCLGTSAQIPPLSSKIIALQKQTDNLYGDTAKIQANVMRSGVLDDNIGIASIFELDGKLSANLNHLYSLQLLLESSTCPDDKPLVKNLKTSLVKYMARMLDGDFGPVYVGMSTTHNLSLISIYHRLDDILKAERELLDEAR